MSFDNFITESQLKQIIEEELASYQKEKIFRRAVALFNLKFPHRKDAEDWLRNKFSEDGVLDYKEISAWTRENRGKDPDAFGIDLDEKKKKKKKRSGGKRDGKGASSKGYSLRDWFKGGGWVQTGGKYDGKPCAKQPGQKTKPYCRDPDDRAKLSKKDRDKRARKKRREDPNPERRGKAKNVSQKKRGKKK